MDKKIKIAIAAGAAAVVVTTGGLLAYFQPWKKDPPPKEPADQQETDKKPQKEEKAEEHYLMVGGEKLPCTLYEQDGWSILVPQGWAVDNGIVWPDKDKHPDAWLRVDPEGEAHGLEFTSIWNKDGVQGHTLSVGTGEPCEVVYQAKPEDMPTYHQVFRAMARSFKKNGKQPLSGLIGSQEPDLHMDNGDTILFMDKLGVPVDEYADKAVKARMSSWPEGDRAGYTGEHRAEKPITWVASYTTKDRFIEVFSCEAAYELSPDSKVTDKVKDGWRHESFYLVLAHQGDGIEESYILWDTKEAPGFHGFLSETLKTKPGK